MIKIPNGSETKVWYF